MTRSSAGVAAGALAALAVAPSPILPDGVSLAFQTGVPSWPK